MASDAASPDEFAEPGLAELYHENTKIRGHQWWTVDGESVRRGPRFREAERRIARIYERFTNSVKEYPHAEQVELPDVRDETLPPLCSVIRKRRSRRAFTGRSIPLRHLAIVLHYSYGVTQKARLETGKEILLRAAPSGGGLYPLEIYPLVLRVEGLEAGTYHYHPTRNRLERIGEGVSSPDIYRNTAEEVLAKAACILCVTGVFARQSVKYGERAYRLTLMDSGFMMEHFYLLATALELDGCVYGGFIDDGVNAMLGVDGVEESCLALFALG